MFITSSIFKMRWNSRKTSLCLCQHPQIAYKVTLRLLLCVGLKTIKKKKNYHYKLIITVFPHPWKHTPFQFHWISLYFPHHFLLSCQISLVTLMSYSADLWTYPRADLWTGIKRRVVESCKRVESLSSMFRVARALQSWQDGCGTWSGDLLIGSAWTGVAGGAGESGSSSSIIVGSGLSVISTFFVFPVTLPIHLQTMLH